MAGGVLINFDNVTIKSYNATLFEGLNFTISEGEHWALIGNSGSGKTTLLNAIAGKHIISQGVFSHPRIDDRVNAVKSIDTPVNWQQFIAQIGARHQFKNSSNTSNFYYQQRYNSADAEDAETVEQYLRKLQRTYTEGQWDYSRVVERLDLLSLADKHLIKLSNGETKRLLIAAALLKNPVLMTMDNPLTGLDVSTRIDFNRLIAEIGASGISIVMASSPGEIPDAITNVAILGDKHIARCIKRTDFSTEKTIRDQELRIDPQAIAQLLYTDKAEIYENIVDMKDVVVRYGSNTILDHINWTIKQGERWALSGPNGSGKSTLLSLINGDNPQAYANNITLFDQKRGSGESIWEIKKKTGFVSPELFQYFPTDNSCLQIIESGFYDTLGLFRQSHSTQLERARQWMELLEIANFGNHLFRNVSASTQRLCLLARALIKNPTLLIFDEPLQGLDAAQQIRFKSIIDLICNNSNTTLIYVTHYVEEIPDCVTHWLTLEEGKRV